MTRGTIGIRRRNWKHAHRLLLHEDQYEFLHVSFDVHVVPLICLVGAIALRTRVLKETHSDRKHILSCSGFFNTHDFLLYERF